MPNRPKPRPTPTPKAFDVFKPGKGRPSPTSRPVIVSSHPQVQDSTVVEKQGAPVANAHHTAIPVAKASHVAAPAPTPTPPGPAPAPTAPAHPKPVLKSLLPQAHETPSHAPHASSMHVPVAHHAKPGTHAAPADEPGAAAPKKISRHGVTIAPPSASAAHKIRPLSGGAKPPVAATKPEEPSEPQLAALPITPVEQPSGTESKVEGKEELLAAMPIEIRRTIASAEGKSAAEWNVPDFSSGAPAAPVAAAAAPQEQAAPTAPAEAPAATPPIDQTPPPVAEQVPTEPVPAPPPSPQEQTPPPAADAKPDTPTKPMSSSQAAAKDRRRSDAAVFIIMFILFLLLATLVVLLFLSGSIAL